MKTTYLCKFDENGRRTKTMLLCEFIKEEKTEKFE